MTSTLTTNLLTAGSGEVVEILHVIGTVSADGGTISIGVADTSTSVTAYAWNKTSMFKNQPREVADLRLETGDSLVGGHTSATDAKLYVVYNVIT
ncbi:MAG: hypothetical protein ACK5X3_01820 [Pseudomonadota bacterium]